MKKNHKGRAIIARLILLIGILGIAFFYFDGCSPARLHRKTITMVDKVISQQTSYEEEIYCQNTHEGRQVFQLDHTLTETQYSSGRLEKVRITDTLLMGIMSIDVPCPSNLSFTSDNDNF